MAYFLINWEQLFVGLILSAFGLLIGYILADRKKVSRPELEKSLNDLNRQREDSIKSLEDRTLLPLVRRVDRIEREAKEFVTRDDLARAVDDLKESQLERHKELKEMLADLKADIRAGRK